LPKRRSREDSIEHTDDGVLVVAAPTSDSEPTTPSSEHAPSYLPPWVDDYEEPGEPQPQPAELSHELPRLPKRRPHRVLSSSEEDGMKLPSWMAAQEEEARVKSTYVDGVDEDMGV